LHDYEYIDKNDDNIEFDYFLIY